MRPRVTRRKFLKQSALAAAALSASGLNAREPSPRSLEGSVTPKRILVIGAGLAGLSAAYELTQTGHDVIILEAQTRPGGRVQTLREPFSDGLYAEAGAARIPGTHEWTLRYAKLFGLTLDPFYPSDGFSTIYFRGRRSKVRPGANLDISDLPLELTPEERKLGLSGLDQKYVVPTLGRLGNLDAPDWPPPPVKNLDQITWPEFLRKQGASPGAIALLELGAAFEGDSALDYLRDDLSHHAKQLYKIRGGNDLLPRAFAARLAEKIRYGSPVVKIEHNAQGARVTFLQAGAPQTLSADRLICAISFSVLKHLEISPPFSPQKQRAIEQVPYDSVVRVFLQSRRKFWTDDALNGFALTDHPMEIWDPTWNQPSPRGILMSYMEDALGRRVTGMPASERLNFALREVEEVFPGIRDNLESATIKVWAEDQWARGAYTVLEPGQITSLGPHLASAEGRVHFAGETTSPWPGWMQGALHSGNRVARQVHEAP